MEREYMNIKEKSKSLYPPMPLAIKTISMPYGLYNLKQSSF